MLRKLALGGIRSRFRDYAVLFSGLVIASAVFYMFLALATNSAFLKSNSTLAMTGFVFYFGEVLLVIITVVYTVYANTFLMSMRQRDYAMFMMLGAKSRKIGQLIFIETVSVGLLATVVGTGVGIGLTTVAGNILTKMLHAPATHFSPVWGPAIFWTLVFFIAMFVVAAFFNAGKLLKTPVLHLLHADTTPNRLQKRRAVLVIQAIAAVILLAIGYWAMTQMMKLQLMAIAIALVTIVLGTYFLFNSLLVALIGALKHRRSASRGLRTFTLSQLSFRIRDYTKILAVVAMLFALALGAITVGLGFSHEIPELLNKQAVYDVTTMDPTAATQAKACQLTGVTAKHTYLEKTDGKYVYLNTAELTAHPVQVVVYSNGDTVRRSLTPTTWAKYADLAGSQLMAFRTPKDGEREFKLVSSAQFDRLPGATRSVTTYQVRDFVANYDAIKAIALAQSKQYGVKDMYQSGQKYYSYELINGMFSGMAFMGFFLGIAFLAMLASTLMFKILSGASYDAKRYLMLQKIGVRPSLLRGSIRQEIGALFLFPGLLGIAHVLFGLKMFVGLLQHPYSNLLVPFGIFIVLYGVYYALTVWLYESIVIKKDIATD